VTGPITAALLAKTPDIYRHDYGLDKYESMIVLTGVSMVLCAVVAVTGRYWTRFTDVIYMVLSSLDRLLQGYFAARV